MKFQYIEKGTHVLQRPLVRGPDAAWEEVLKEGRNLIYVPSSRRHDPSLPGYDKNWFMLAYGEAEAHEYSLIFVLLFPCPIFMVTTVFGPRDPALRLFPRSKSKAKYISVEADCLSSNGSIDMLSAKIGAL